MFKFKINYAWSRQAKEKFKNCLSGKLLKKNLGIALQFVNRVHYLPHTQQKFVTHAEGLLWPGEYMKRWDFVRSTKL